MKYAVILFGVSILLSLVLLNPTVKQKTMSFFLDTQKQVLSQLEMQSQGRTYKIVKVQNLNGLAVELYKIEDGELIFLDSKELTDKKDAFYKFGDKKHNLFLKDINSDGSPEVILPSLDKNMKARLNVYTFDSVNETLEKQSQH